MTLHAEYDPSNIFAQILAGEMSAVRVYEDANVIVIMDVFPQSRGHCLVIPRTPSRNILEVSAKDIGRVFGAVQRVAKAVDKALRPDGITITQFNGAPAGQTVFHTHIHIIPRFSDEPLAGHGHDNMADMEVLSALAKKISAAL